MAPDCRRSHPANDESPSGVTMRNTVAGRPAGRLPVCAEARWRRRVCTAPGLPRVVRVVRPSAKTSIGRIATADFATTVGSSPNRPASVATIAVRAAALVESLPEHFADRRGGFPALRRGHCSWRPGPRAKASVGRGGETVRHRLLAEASRGGSWRQVGIGHQGRDADRWCGLGPRQSERFQKGGSAAGNRRIVVSAGLGPRTSAEAPPSILTAQDVDKDTAAFIGNGAGLGGRSAWRRRRKVGGKMGGAAFRHRAILESNSAG